MRCILNFSIGASHIINLFDDRTWRSANVQWKTGTWEIAEDNVTIFYSGDESGMYTMSPFELQPFVTKAFEDAFLKEANDEDTLECSGSGS